MSVPPLSRAGIGDPACSVDTSSPRLRPSIFGVPPRRLRSLATEASVWLSRARAGSLAGHERSAVWLQMQRVSARPRPGRGGTEVSTALVPVRGHQNRSVGGHRPGSSGGGAPEEAAWRRQSFSVFAAVQVRPHAWLRGGTVGVPDRRPLCGPGSVCPAGPLGRTRRRPGRKWRPVINSMRFRAVALT